MVLELQQKDYHGMIIQYLLVYLLMQVHDMKQNQIMVVHIS